MNVVIDKEIQAAKLALTQNNKKKALLALKKKKYQEQLLEKTEQQLLNLEELVRIEKERDGALGSEEWTDGS